MNFEALAKKAKGMIKELVGKEAVSVVSIGKGEKGKWLVLIDVLERKAVPDTQSLIGMYKLTFNNEMKLEGYGRVEMRRKADVGTWGAEGKMEE